MRWVEVKILVVVVVAAAAPVAAPDVARVGWAAPKLPVPVAVASAPTVGIKYHTLLVSLVTRGGAPSAARR